MIRKKHFYLAVSILLLITSITLLQALTGNNSEIAWAENTMGMFEATNSSTSSNYASRTSGATFLTGMYVFDDGFGRFGILKNTSAYCGNGLIELDEICDDGTSNGIVCSPDCETTCTYCNSACIETSVTGESCGGGGGGGGGSTCTNECSPSGATESICSNETTISSRICSMQADGCTDWISAGEEYCTSQKICENGACIQQTCVEDWQCAEWSECFLGNIDNQSLEEELIRARTCTQISPTCISLGETMEEIIKCDEEICEGDWKCEYTICTEEDQYYYNQYCSHPCDDAIGNPDGEIAGNCSDRPADSSRNGCNPQWTCEKWEECDASYSTNDILSGTINKNGQQTRTCKDKTNCMKDTTDKKPCKLEIPVKTSTSEWCEEEYVEIRKKENNELISRIKETEIAGFTKLNRIDINFETSAFSGYCTYCFDKIKNHDETDIDCGGPSCPECITPKKYTDWIIYIIILSWTMLVLLLSVLAIEEKEKIITTIEYLRLASLNDAEIERKILLFLRNHLRLPFKIPEAKFSKIKNLEQRPHTLKKIKIISKEKLKKNWITAAIKGIRKKKRTGFLGDEGNIDEARKELEKKWYKS